MPLRVGAGIDLAPLEDRGVVATGRLEGGTLLVTGLTPAASPQRPTAPAPAPATVAHERARRPDAERRLMHDDALLDAWDSVDDAGSRIRVAVATDIGRVRRELLPHYGDTLSVVQSRWNGEMLDRIETLIARSGVACLFGYESTSGTQLRSAAVLLHLPSALARSLSQFPPESVHIDVLVRPGRYRPEVHWKTAGLH